MEPPQPCRHNDRCGEAKRISLTPKVKPSPALTRGALVQEGIQMGHAANTGDILAVELFKEEFPYMLCKVAPAGEAHLNQESFSNWFADFKPGDEVLVVDFLLPGAPGSNTYSFAEKDPISIFIEDIRLADIDLEPLDGVATRRPKFQISSDTHAKILKRLQLIKD